MECTTTRSIAAPGGRGPKLGEAMPCAKRYQPPRQSGSAASGVAVAVIRVFVPRRGDGQPGDAVADLAQAQPQALRRGGAVEVGLAQRLDQDLALLLVQVSLQVAGDGRRRRRCG